MKPTLAACLFLALCAPLSAQAPSPPSPSSQAESVGEAPAGSGLEAIHAGEPLRLRSSMEDPEPSPVAAAGWCTFRDSSEPADPVASEAEEPEPPAAEQTQACDVGIGASLYRWKRAAVVGVLGSKTLGFGFGWIIGRPAGRTLAVATGVVCSWSSQGIASDDCRPALGATLSLVRATP